MAKWIEYGGTSLLSRGGADLMGPNMNYVRKDVVDNWDYDSDLVHIDRIAPGLPTVGYLGFNRKKGLYFWISANGSCRAFNPLTGGLGKTMRAPAKVRDIIRSYEKKMAAQKVAKKKSKIVKRK